MVFEVKQESFRSTQPTVTAIGFSLASHLAERDPNPEIIIGRDTRESGESIERALIEGANRAGVKCLSAGVITTPGVAFLTRKHRAAAGVVISASHNPYQDNGIKIFAPSGEKMDDSVERMIEADIFAQNRAPVFSRFSRHAIVTGTSRETSAGVSVVSRRRNWKRSESGRSDDGGRLCKRRQFGSRSSFIRRDSARESSRSTLLRTVRNINRDCGSLHIDSLRQRVVNEHADLGVAFDGDADRSLFIDNSGNFVDGDATLWALATHLQSHGKLKDNTVVATVMSNIGLEIAFRSAGIRLVRTDVGDKYVLEELLRLGASLGGEQSGHIIMPELSLAGDGMITALCLLRALRESRKTLGRDDSWI